MRELSFMATQDDAGTVAANALKPQSASSDAGSVTQFPVGDQIEAVRFNAATKARAQRLRGVMFTKLTAPGAVSDQQGTGQGGVGSGNFSGGV
jgi:hypothetical protein